ncbi:hypothetical protein AVEN_244763-1 [Araneus ventricosus]|uniref:Uncharacterized protein n=1 Tax=Araneus ventricosus TaxID=182803 RepID=A0A4Y2BUJ1_ARAVE|nr:hypothetical protein AVEN_244763-1 [Araneus ventricosus]
MLQYLPPTPTQEIRDSVCTMTPFFVMEDYWSRRQQVVSLSSECWRQLMSQEFKIVGSINILSSRYSVVQYHSVNVICNNEHIVRALCLSLCTSRHLTILLSNNLLSPHAFT